MRIGSVFGKFRRARAVRRAAAFLGDIGKADVTANSASIAFYFFISMIPLFILLCSQIPFTGISKAEMTAAFTSRLPESVKGLVSSIISEAYNQRIGIFSFSVIVLLWSSSKCVMAMIRSLDVIYRVRDRRGMLNMYVFSLFFTMCIVLVISALLVFSTKERTAEDIFRYFGNSSEFAGKLGGFFKDFDIFLLGLAAVSAIYKIAPAGKRKLVHQIPGAAFSVFAISKFTDIFTKYSGGANIYKSFYGSLTTISIFLIWVYSCFMIFLIGGVINSHFRSSFESFTAGIASFFRAHREKRREKRRRKRELSENNGAYVSGRPTREGRDREKALMRADRK